jgi:hypothetical protein
VLRGYTVAPFQCFSVSVFQCFSVSVFQCFSVSVFQCFSVSVFQCFSVSVFQCFSGSAAVAVVWIVRSPPSRCAGFDVRSTVAGFRRCTCVVTHNCGFLRVQLVSEAAGGRTVTKLFKFLHVAGPATTQSEFFCASGICDLLNSSLAGSVRARAGLEERRRY